MPKPAAPAITPTREQDFPEWYQQIIREADLAENSETRGCMVIKPWGYGIWERIQSNLDKRFKAMGHQNAYFPLLIPLSYLEKEAEHAEGFATECAVVTHHRLEAQKQADGSTKMIPTGALAEPYVVRPTSETIIGAAFSRWIQSYRDLPLRINQWANVMRWEMRPRLFLRTAEFLWQEGHTAHATEQEALEQTHAMHALYADFLCSFLAIPTFMGEKTEAERFPGAQNTLTIEAMVQDKKAIQAGTSHYLGTNFSRSSGITFSNQEGQRQHAFTTSWGVSTRLIGTLIMAHSDDDGLVLPPAVAPTQIVIIPITPKKDSQQAIIDACHALAEILRRDGSFDKEPLRVHVDDRPLGGGHKKWEWVKKGVPIRIEIGPRDIESAKVCLQRRDQPSLTKHFLEKENFIREAGNLLEEIQENLLEKAKQLREENTSLCSDIQAFNKHWDTESPGWLLTPWEGSREEEEKLSKAHKISIRCLPFLNETPPALPCILTGKPTQQRALWARSY